LSRRYDHTRLLSALELAYRARNPRSLQADRDARQVLIDGFSHGARACKPFTPRTVRSDGAYITDLDGHRLIDFWQGHYANILGHNPALIRETLVERLRLGEGLHTGVLETQEAEYAQLLADTLGAERVRLTTAGTLATLYAMMMARAYTKRSLVVKVAGGWHGANPLALKGVSRRPDDGYDQVDSAGIGQGADRDILVTRFNDVDALEDLFRRHGDQIACFIFELCPSKAGFIAATPEYVRAARSLTERYGALLIADEVITGFRFCAGGLQRLYGLRPDLTTLGKIIGGGMPVSAVAGRADVMASISQDARPRVWFNGGTFSAHPLSLVAGRAMIEHLIAKESRIYPELGQKGARLRDGIDQIMIDRSIDARTTGHPNAATGASSLGGLYFALCDGVHPTCAEDLSDPAQCDVTMVEQVLKLYLLLQDVHIMHGLGVVATSHSEQDIDHVLEAFDGFCLWLRRMA